MGFKLIDNKESNKEALSKAAKETFLFLGAEFEVNLKVVSDTEMAILNEKYRGIKGTTNVLSFKNDENEPGGDIIISNTQVHIDAKKWNLGTQETLQLLLVHGILHLAGFEHTKTADRDKMEASEKKIMSKLGIEIFR